MQSKHTNPDLAAVIDAIQDVAGDDMLALVLNQLELSRHAAQHLMGREVDELSGARYRHDKPNAGRYSRWGHNPGSIGVSGQRLPVHVPSVRDDDTGRTFSPPVYQRLRAMEQPPLHVMQALFPGLGTRQYREVAQLPMDSFGVSKSRLSERFVEHSREVLEGFLQRRLDDATYVAMFIDGKRMQGQ